MTGLVVTGVSKSFGGVRVLHGVELAAPPGRVTALIGPNGAGKSTLANIVSGLERPDAGRVHVSGVDVTRQPAHRRAAAGLARTFQNLAVFAGLSVLDNVMMGGYGNPDRRDEARLRGIARDLLDRFGIAHLAGVPVDALPFGQAKLVELARALALDPRVVVLDEPAAGLAADGVEVVSRHITAMAAAGAAVLLIEHNMRMVMEVSHHILVLDHGELLASGDPEAVRADPRVIDAYLGGAA